MHASPAEPINPIAFHICMFDEPLWEVAFICHLLANAVTTNAA
jgi:hypothetical protein